MLQGTAVDMLGWMMSSLENIVYRNQFNTCSQKPIFQQKRSAVSLKVFLENLILEVNTRTCDFLSIEENNHFEQFTSHKNYTQVYYGPNLYFSVKGTTTLYCL